MPDRELITERLADSQLHIVERQLAGGMARRDFEHDELDARRVRPFCEHGLQSEGRVGSNGLLILGRHFCQRSIFRQLRLQRIGVPLRQ